MNFQPSKTKMLWILMRYQYNWAIGFISDITIWKIHGGGGGVRIEVRVSGPANVNQ